MFGLVYAVIPIFPSFITLVPANVPGISLVPRAIAYALLLLVGLCGIYTIVALWQRPRSQQPLLVPLLVWLGAGLLSALLGFDPAGGLLFLGIFGLGVVWNCALMRFYSDPGVAPTIFRTYLISGALASLCAIAMVALRVPAAQYAIGHGRAIGTFILPGELAGYAIVQIPIAFAIANVSTSRALRTLAWIALAADLVAMVLTYSRTGWMGLAAAIATLAFARARGGRRGAAVAIAVVVAGVALVLAAFNAHHNPSENYTRLSIWQAALSIVERFPLTGIGPFGFSHVYPLVRLPDGDASAFHAHSVYLTFLAELGVVGCAAAAWAWWRFAREFAKRIRSATPAGSALAYAALAGLVGTLVQGLIDTVSVVIFCLWLPTMALALLAADRGLAEERP